ncbi:MAG: hypothetical protein ACOYEV_15695 [Candidatus Nanopelagicales bacterium]
MTLFPEPLWPGGALDPAAQAAITGLLALLAARPVPAALAEGDRPANEPRSGIKSTSWRTSAWPPNWQPQRPAQPCRSAVAVGNSK